MKSNRQSRAGQTLNAVTRSEKETMTLARNLARKFRGREVVLLIGPLGVGKTIFAKGIASGLGLRDPRPVCSPSFTILNIYQAKFPVFHFDLYRLEREGDILELGWEDYLGRGVVLVEWGEKIPFELVAIRVSIVRGKDDERRITIEMPPSMSNQ
ncbi:MAG: tRNA (adenosine(37)-N6)-threonylcarbamoyltransferase complex ATPase subunit type 1 TsaE [Candidatus Aminicenantales bacterium]